MKAAKIKAFTLIEFLIALVIIGFIVAILINFFSNPMQEASLNRSVSKISDDTRVIADSTASYIMNKSIELTAADGINTLASGANAPMTGIPVPPTAALMTGHTSNLYELDDSAAEYKKWGDVANQDTVLVLQNVVIDVCNRINKNAGLSDSTPDVAVDPTKDIQCWDAAGDGSNYTIVKPLYIH